MRLEVPASFVEVKHAIFHAPIYLTCFALFLWIWYCHHQFHRRYGLEDPLTVALDGAILFVVLLFALPLRFVAEMIYSQVRFSGSLLRRDMSGAPLADETGASVPMIEPADLDLVMLFYASGFALLFALFALQTALALRRADELQLDTVERAVTRGTIRAHVLSAAIGLAALALALLPGIPRQFSGATFFIMGPAHGLLGWWQGRNVRALGAALELHPGGSSGS